MIALGGIVLGLVLLIAGGAALVQGASQIATRLGLSPMVVGLTIVGFGTSAPELVVNVIGALNGQTELAFGNVVGSNIANFGLVLGIAAIIAPIQIQGNLVRRELPLLLLATTIMMVMALDGPLRGEQGVIDSSDSIVLLLIFSIFIYMLALDILRMRRPERALQPDRLLIDIESSPLILSDLAERFCILQVLGGIAFLFVGGQMTVHFGVALAESLQVSSAIVGLFAIAIGTSMPELVTSIIAAMRGESDLAVGNVVGSNIFNGLLVLPVTGLVGNITVPTGGVGDLVFSWLLATALVPVFFFRKARLGRAIGAVLLVSYASYMFLRLTGQLP